MAELVLDFTATDTVNISFDGADSGKLDFTNPMTEKDRSDIVWYVETYGARSLADPDDQEARRIEQRLPEIGKALFGAVISSMPAYEIFMAYRNTPSQGRVLTVKSQDATILSLPWELLHDTSSPGAFLFRDKPHISIRRRISGATMRPFRLTTKDRLHLLFVVSRPTDAGFLDPRADPQAVLDALDEHAPGRVTCEFLRPATLDALAERLDDDSKPSIDILHFDGHGVFAQVSEEDVERDRAKFGGSILSEIQKERHARHTRGEETAGHRVGIGFLVFEKEDRSKQLISAEDLANELYRAKVGLVVLSACQTASLDEEGDPMASVAGRLTGTGIPAILAMTHSVLVATTRMLFGKFYESLAKGRGIASSLDDARAQLARQPEKYKVLRGGQPEMLKLQDWFLPALFHGGASTPMLSAGEQVSSDETPTKHNLRPPHEAGFFGRKRELWDIAYWFGTGQTQRISITGFGGQGKTELGMEAGRWLLRTGMFQQAVFVNYADVQAEDALSVAVSTISAVTERTLSNEQEVGELLDKVPTLIILDNLETVPEAALKELLDAASKWSTVGDSRVLLTSRIPDTGHPDYAVEGTRAHRRIVLDGLGSASYPDDALDWFRELDLLPTAAPREVPPPTRDDLIRLFDRVQFHPLSICVLVQQLKTQTAGKLEKRLAALLSDDAVSLVAAPGTPERLVASLQLSLERLSDAEREAVKRLGVFQSGAFEDDLLVITGLGESEQQREQMQRRLAALESGDPRIVLQAMGMDLPADAEIPPELVSQLTDNPELQQHIEKLRAELVALDGRPEQGRELPEQREGEHDGESPVDPNQPVPATAAPAQAAFARSGLQENVWPGLRCSLESAALIEAESVPGVGPPFLRFHPTLAPMLWASLDVDQQDALTLAHRQRYYALSGYLYQEDPKNPHQTRAIAQRELPNLLHAVQRALDAGDEDAVDFAANVNKFLINFGMTREAAILTRRAEQAGGERGSRAWILAQSARGEQLLEARRVTESAQIFSGILDTLGDEPTYEHVATLLRIGRCYEAGGRLDQAEAAHRQGIAVTEQLEAGDDVKRIRGTLHTDLADVLAGQGRFAEAREQYENSLSIKRDTGRELRGEGVVLGQLGTLALREGDLAGAVKRYHEALDLFQRLGEPATEAAIQHQLGMAFQVAKQWEQAEQHYREAARLHEQLGDLAGAAQTWNNLAAGCESAGKPEAAETWYRKAIEGMQNPPSGDRGAKCLNNLSDLLRIRPGRLAEARQLAEEALAISQPLDPAAAEIWKTYGILAQIADQQSELEQAAEYHRLAREAKRNYAGTAHEMKQYAELIAAVVLVCGGSDELRAVVDAHTDAMRKGGSEWNACADAIKQILAGERDAESLCATVGGTTAMVIETMLQAIEDPAALESLLPPDVQDGET